MARTKLVAGNWKMHGQIAGNLTLLTALKDGVAASRAELAVCVPFPYLAQARSALAGTPIACDAE